MIFIAIAAAAATYVGLVLFALALCRAAGRADQRMDQHVNSMIAQADDLDHDERFCAAIGVENPWA